jgi:hypothetical protein
MQMQRCEDASSAWLTLKLQSLQMGCLWSGFPGGKKKEKKGKTVAKLRSQGKARHHRSRHVLSLPPLLIFLASPV